MSRLSFTAGAPLSPEQIAKLQSVGVINESMRAVSLDEFNKSQKDAPPLEIPPVTPPPKTVELSSLDAAKQREIMEAVSLASKLNPSSTTESKPAASAPVQAATVGADATTIDPKTPCEKCGQLPDLKLPCVHCGQNPKEATPVSEEDKEKWMLFILSGDSTKRFTKKYSFIGGKMNITFRTLSVRETSLINDRIKFELDNKLIAIPNQEMAMYAVNFRRVLLTIAASIEELSPRFGSAIPGVLSPKMNEFLPEKLSKRSASEVLLDLYDYLIEDGSSVYQNLLVSNFYDFERITAELTAGSQNPSFFKAAV